MKKTRLIPFGMLPQHWALRGKNRDIAEAEYSLVGYDLQYRLLEIEYSGIRTPIDDKNFKLKKLTLDLDYGKIDHFEHDLAVAALEYPNKKSFEYKRAVLEAKLEHGEIEQLDHDLKLVELQYKSKESTEYKIAVANVNRQHDQLTEREYNKEIATIKGEPWVEVIHAKINYDSEDGNAFEFELDWNQPFVEDLLRHGYVGPTQADIVDQWFTQTCQDVFNTDPDFMMPDEIPSASTTQRKSNDGKTEFS